VLLTDQVLGRHAHVGEEHLVEAAAAGHVPDGSHLDAVEVHRDDEVGDADVLRLIDIGARDEDAVLRPLGK
jgi:hypothetical protein